MQETPNESTLQTPKAASWRNLGGAALAVLAATAFSVQSILARSSYDHGANALTLLTVQRWVTAGLLLGYFVFRKKRPWLRGRLLVASIAIGLVFCAQSYGLLGAMQLVPVSLAVLILYLFPVLVTLAAWLVDGQRPTPLTVLGLLLAFGGLALALEPGRGVRLDGTGLVLAGVSAVAMCIMLVASTRVMRHTESLVVTFHLILISGLLYTTILVLAGPSWPQSATGWAALGGAVAGFSIAYISMFVALGLIGAFRTSLLMNGEPIITLGLAALLLGEALGLPQLLGALLVVVAIVAVQTAGRAKARE